MIVPSPLVEAAKPNQQLRFFSETRALQPGEKITTRAMRISYAHVLLCTVRFVLRCLAKRAALAVLLAACSPTEYDPYRVTCCRLLETSNSVSL